MMTDIELPAGRPLAEIPDEELDVAFAGAVLELSAHTNKELFALLRTAWPLMGLWAVSGLLLGSALGRALPPWAIAALCGAVGFAAGYDLFRCRRRLATLRKVRPSNQRVSEIALERARRLSGGLIH